MNEQNEMPNGADHSVPVMGIDPVAPLAPPKVRAKRKRKSKKVAKPRAPRTKRIDPILHESQASKAAPQALLMSRDVPCEEVPAVAPASVGATSFREGLRHMVGFDPTQHEPDVDGSRDVDEPPAFLDLARRDVTIALVVLVGFVIAGATLPIWYGW